MQADFSSGGLAALLDENKKLKLALESIICWAGESPDGPEWATPEAKQKNRAMFEAALQAACECFQDSYPIETGANR
jgi:hypothetical protein